MRVPIAVQTRTFDFDTVQQQLGEARDAFVRYLNDVPRKSTRSKHGLMGPVGKILSEVKSGRRDPASLKGYAVRVHEATGRAPSADGLRALEEGLNLLIRLLKESPATAHDRILDNLDYGLYFDLRKRAIESKEERLQAWIAFVRTKYESDTLLSESWNERITFDDLYLPRKAEGSRSKKATLKQRDIVEFWESQGSTVAIDDEEDQ